VITARTITARTITARTTTARATTARTTTARAITARPIPVRTIPAPLAVAWAARSVPRATVTVIPPLRERVRRPSRREAPRFRPDPLGTRSARPRHARPAGLGGRLLSLGLVVAGVAGVAVRSIGAPAAEPAIARPAPVHASPVALHAAEPCPIDHRLGESWVEPLIACEALVWRVPGGPAKALSVARCESRLVTTVLNPSGCDGSGCSGVFQQSLRYWAGRAAEYGFAGVPPTDVRANVIVSMRMAAERGTWARDWPVCGR
jgi:hypothetical protein